MTDRDTAPALRGGAPSGRTAALFDMDRTLVRSHSGSLFVRHQRRKGQATYRDSLRVAYWLMQYTFGVIDAERAAAKAMEGFRGRSERWLTDECHELFEHFMRSDIAEAGRHAVREHQGRGDFVAIVTGATPYAARPLAVELGIEHVIATELEVQDGLFTGRVQQPMSYGAGKVVLSERLAGQHAFSLDQATFYSDSITDLPLLERVGTPVAINPDARLRRIAKKRGWRIETW
jgi:HAD superfamily hydrolase (TIGR01490 family)